MWKDSNRNIVVIFQPNILRIVGFYVRRSTIESYFTYLEQKSLIIVGTKIQHSGHSVCANSDKFDEIP